MASDLDIAALRRQLLDAAEQLQAVTAERDRLQDMKEAEWEAAKHRYCDLPVSAESLDTATAFVRRWFGQPNKDEATDARELARMFDAVAADAVRNPTKIDYEAAVLADRCTERHYSLGHKVNIRCQLAVGHVGMHVAQWEVGNRCEWQDQQ